MTFSFCNLTIRHIIMPYLVEALGPGHWDAVAPRRRDEAHGRLAARGAVALAVVVHLAAEAGAAAGILAGEEVHLRGCAWWHRRAGECGGGCGEGLAAARREDEREEDDHGEEEHRPDGVEERPLPLPAAAAAAAGEGAPAVRAQGAEEAHGEARRRRR
ncbi:Os04g0569500, partial [Oryza sativa Japonica Group]